MLVNTTDAFLATDSFETSRAPEVELFAVAYDAGSEAHSEPCTFIPGPACGSSGAHDPAAAEGFVYVSNGVQGIGDLDTTVYDWSNPVAKLTIRRMSSMR